MSEPLEAQRFAPPRAELWLALVVIAVIAMMIVPLPTPLIDLLIALNLGFGVLLISAALYMRDALSFAAFPTLLLLSTLYRLALNVASTRLILLQADAGRVIRAFGSFVVRGDYRVGALVFAMLTLIQFIVIARGAERVAEVSARFSLDALPGKQLAIDAELRTGALRPAAARIERRRLERESQLYGALDGALKFVKGDAIAGIVITAVNFVGGVAIGVFARG
ncbi:MAG TPA: FHIPEP family type III secretion protein, partial [Polyangiaceae bacterium]|nr:FHIPEP family type III secretion protein [Polyangiaceae bacterium]